MNYQYRQRITWPLTGDSLRTLWRWVSPLVAVVAAWVGYVLLFTIFEWLGAK